MDFWTFIVCCTGIWGVVQIFETGFYRLGKNHSSGLEKRVSELEDEVKKLKKNKEITQNSTLNNKEISQMPMAWPVLQNPDDMR